MELQYIWNPPGDDESQWVPVFINIENSQPVNGFRVGVRAWDDSQDIGSQYPPFEIVNQELEDIDPVLASIDTFGATGSSLGGGEYLFGGIVDGSQYIYEEVFDQSKFWVVERESGNTKDTYVGEVDVGSNIPDEPYDPTQDIYPIDSLTQYLPDTRWFVDVVYRINTTYTVFGFTYNEETTFVHRVYQNLWEWGPYVKSEIEKTYYANGFTKSAPLKP